MTTKKSEKREIERQPRWVRYGLSLSLVPLVAGLIFILAFAFDYDLFGAKENQLSIGFLLFLLSFAMSNAFQQRWNLFAGWTLLMLADLVTLLITQSLPAQIAALVLAVMGLIFLGREYFRRIRANQQ